MKFSTSLTAFAITALMMTGCKNTETEPASAETASTEVVAAKPQTASFKIEGMSCAIGCAKTIETKLAKVDGVTKVSVDYEKKTATVEFDAAKQSPEKFVEIVEAAADGKTYKVSDLRSSGDQAMAFIGDKNKEKKKKKKKAAASSEEKKEGCSSEATPAKPGCCAAKKASCASKV